MNLSARALNDAREITAGLLEQLGLDAYLFEVEPHDGPWGVRVECAHAEGWQTVLLAVDLRAPARLPRRRRGARAAARGLGRTSGRVPLRALIPHSTMQTLTKDMYALSDDVALLIAILPPDLQKPARELPADTLMEIVMDLGRPPEARLPERAAPLANRPVSRDDLGYVLERVGEFTEDNRAGIERTLHRISAIRNRKGDVIGLTLRAGRAVFGTIDIVRDLLESGRNLPLLGRPGVGKTTLLRESARVLADDLGKRVIVVDTSNEIAGDSDVPRPAIGASRRMQVPYPERQHAVMIEAVENHMPQVIVIDEIGTEPEAQAARTIAERGVQLISTAHGNTLENLVMNPTLSDLVGGVHTVTLSDEEARRAGPTRPSTNGARRRPSTWWSRSWRAASWWCTRIPPTPWTGCSRAWIPAASRACARGRARYGVPR